MSKQIRTALGVRQAENFADWYQACVRAADLGEDSGVRGCMIMKAWGTALWERMKFILNAEIEATGHENYTFPLLIPLRHFEKEAEHVQGFAKEMAIVTHHRIKEVDGALQLDSDAKLEEPLAIRPTSELIIGEAMSRWIQSYRDLPLLLNQWANVMRWEMRPRLFLRTSEFFWQEGHTAHATREEALEETEKMYNVYRSFARDTLGIEVVGGRKPPHERFPGAVETYTIEAMMLDGHALQSGTSHYLGTNFARAQNIQYQDDKGVLQHVHTTSWGLSTRMIGAVVMVHGDDDGLRLSPRIAPKQVVIIPMIKDREEDASVLEYCDHLAALFSDLKCMGEPLRVRVDLTNDRAQNKRWSWVKKGVPLILEIGPRDAASHQVTFLRRDNLRDNSGKVVQHQSTQSDLVAALPSLLEEIQDGFLDRSQKFLDEHDHSDIRTPDELATLFESGEPAWATVPWSNPTAEELSMVVDLLKDLKLTVRVVPFAQGEVGERCIFTGKPAVENIVLGRAY